MKRLTKNISIYTLGFITALGIGVYAAVSYNANEIKYKNKTVEKALDDLYKGQRGKTGVYGVKRDINTSSTTWERIEDSKGLIANATKDGSEVQNDFDNIYPWNDIKTCNYDTGTKQKGACYGEQGFTFTPEGNVEVMTYIPEFYYKREQKNGYEYIYISKNAMPSFEKSEAFSIGRYTMSGDASRVHSRSGAIPLGNSTITQYRTYAQNIGMQQLDYHHFIIQLLYLVEYADYNSQAKLGVGYTALSNSQAIESGGCNDLGMKSGILNDDGKHSMIYRGIEDIYGNVWQFVDGINIKNYKTYICYDASKYKSDTFNDGSGNAYNECYKPIGYTNANTNEYITKLGYDISNPLITLPTATGGTELTYISDRYYQISGTKVAFVGGYYKNAGDAGMFFIYANCNSSDNSADGGGARLLKTN